MCKKNNYRGYRWWICSSKKSILYGFLLLLKMRDNVWVWAENSQRSCTKEGLSLCSLESCQELAGHQARIVYMKWRIPNVQQSVRNSTALSKVSHADRTGTPEDTQLDWDRPIYNPLCHCTLVHFHSMMHGTHIWYRSISFPSCDLCLWTWL